MNRTSPKRQSKTYSDTSTINSNGNGSTSSDHNSVVPPRIARAIALGEYERVIKDLNKEGSQFWVKNTRAVCFLRVGGYQEAVNIYRTFVLASGGISLKSDLATIYRTNYAVALLLMGLPSGCLAALVGIDPSNETVRKLRAAIRTWEAKLSFWQWLNWKVGGMDPPGCRIPIDFPPGEFDFAVPKADTAIAG